jgi:hypothetical protein
MAFPSSSSYLRYDRHGALWLVGMEQAGSLDRAGSRRDIARRSGALRRYREPI